jgi:hypothetical protein
MFYSNYGSLNYGRKSKIGDHFDASRRRVDKGFREIMRPVGLEFSLFLRSVITSHRTGGASISTLTRKM